MGNITIFFLQLLILTIFFVLLITVNALVTSLFVRRITGTDLKRFFLSWCGIILLIQIVAFVGAIPLPMEEEGLPFVFLFVMPIVVGAFVLDKIIKKTNPKNGEKNIRTWQSMGIAALAQVLSWLASFWLLPKYH